MWCRSSIGTMWIKVSVSGHAVGLPDVDEIREVGKAAHFCNKEGNSYPRLRLLAWPTSLPVFNMSINPVKSQYTHATCKSRSNVLLPMKARGVPKVVFPAEAEGSEKFGLWLNIEADAKGTNNT